VTRDITEKREAQEALQLAQQELFQAQKMEAVGQLTGGVAHDFNNLLMAILGSLEIARKRALAGQNVIDLIDNAIKGAQRGASLTQRLLAFSRKQELKLEAVDVPDLVRGMAELLQRSLGPTVEISVNFPLKLPLVQSDPNQLASALLNLAVNARDAMTDGGMITIAARRRSLRKREISDLKEGDYVCLSVTDEGEGMDAETLEKAMTPFFTTKGIGKGTGLGLPMVQGLMAQSGGKLRIRSTKGEGTTAEMWIPLADVVEESVPEAPQVEPRNDRRLTVLAVDDDPLVITNTVLMLEELGHDVVQAHSGEEALQRLNEDLTFDLVLTDFSMPRMTGAQLAEQIRERMPDLPIVLATGYAELAEGSPGAELPRLAKPFSQSELEKALRAAVPD
jgi:nitrogen-specific signal transduction histidine kinase